MIDNLIKIDMMPHLKANNTIKKILFIGIMYYE